MPSIDCPTRRPSSPAPELARHIGDRFVQRLRRRGACFEQGVSHLTEATSLITKSRRSRWSRRDRAGFFAIFATRRAFRHRRDSGSCLTHPSVIPSCERAPRASHASGARRRRGAARRCRGEAGWPGPWSEPTRCAAGTRAERFLASCSGPAIRGVDRQRCQCLRLTTAPHSGTYTTRRRQGTSAGRVPGERSGPWPASLVATSRSGGPASRGQSSRVIERV